MSTGYGWEGIRQVCATLLGARHVYLSASEVAVSILGALYKCSTFTFTFTFLGRKSPPGACNDSCDVITRHRPRIGTRGRTNQRTQGTNKPTNMTDCNAPFLVLTAITKVSRMVLVLLTQFNSTQFIKKWQPEG